MVFARGLGIRCLSTTCSWCNPWTGWVRMGLEEGFFQNNACGAGGDAAHWYCSAAKRCLLLPVCCVCGGVVGDDAWRWLCAHTLRFIRAWRRRKRAALLLRTLPHQPFPAPNIVNVTYDYAFVLALRSANARCWRVRVPAARSVLVYRRYSIKPSDALLHTTVCRDGGAAVRMLARAFLFIFPLVLEHLPLPHTRTWRGGDARHFALPSQTTALIPIHRFPLPRLCRALPAAHARSAANCVTFDSSLLHIFTARWRHRHYSVHQTYCRA